MNRGTIRGAGLGVAIALALVGPTQAQDVAEGGRCLESEQMGSLGITGIKCDRCRFITEGGASRAVFFTEPTILSLDPSLPASRVLRPGDVIVALEGQLITTAEGSARYSSLPPNGAVSLRVRRDGRWSSPSPPPYRSPPGRRKVWIRSTCRPSSHWASDSSAPAARTRLPRTDRACGASPRRPTSS
jgi:hypothetical protein